MKFSGRIYLIVPICLCLALSASALSPSSQKMLAEDKPMLVIIHSCLGFCTLPDEIYLLLYPNGQAQTELAPGKTIHTFKIKRKVVTQLIKFINSPDFLKGQEEYRPLMIDSDRAQFTKIKYNYDGQERQIILINYDEKDPSGQNPYPVSVREVMQRVKAIVEEQRKKGG